jgi:hypothetical protein
MTPTVRRACRLLLLAVLAAAVPLWAEDPPPAETKSPKKAPPAPAAGAVEVHFTEDSVLKLILREERLELTTPYGKLLIPVAAIRRIDFATRIPDDVARRIRAALRDLGSTEFRVREDASAELLALREKAYPALLEAAKNKDPEVARRANDLLEKIREAVPEEKLEVRKVDVVYTDDSKIAGRIEASVWKANTAQFGEVQMKLADLRTLRSLASDSEADFGPPLPDPGNLMLYQLQVGKRFAFKVTGANFGAIYGTDTYTGDSMLAMAAVHAGVLKVGQTGVVRVKIVAPPAAFVSSTRNGIFSNPFGAYPGAYQVVP